MWSWLFSKYVMASRTVFRFSEPSSLFSSNSRRRLRRRSRPCRPGSSADDAWRTAQRPRSPFCGNNSRLPRRARSRERCRECRSLGQTRIAACPTTTVPHPASRSAFSSAGISLLHSNARLQNSHSRPLTGSPSKIRVISAQTRLCCGRGRSLLRSRRAISSSTWSVVRGKRSIV